MAVLQAVAAGRIGWVFEYPIDDVYIHLALAEQLASGNYGINTGEFSTPASSILYPFLLVPFPGTEIQRLIPLFWNLAGLAGAAVFWGLIVARAGLGAVPSFLLAVLGPISLNFVGVAFLGMEHTLHVAFSLALFWGWLRVFEEETMPAFLWAAAPICVMLRYESLALVFVIAATVAWRFGMWRGAALGAISALPVVIFGAIMRALGEGALPNSVQMKITGSFSAAEGAAEVGMGLLFLIARNMNEAGAVVILGLCFALIVVAATTRENRRFVWPLAGMVLALAAANFVLGRIGWMNRYEIHVVAVLAATFVIVAGKAGLTRPGLLAVAVVAFAGWKYARDLAFFFPDAPAAVHLQQAQMARFAQDFHDGPVAVNDLGRVAWGNPSYVFDLVGLASTETRRILTSGRPQEDWPDAYFEAYDVPVAIIYESWLGWAVGEDWTLLGQLVFEGNSAVISEPRVSFYATPVGHPADILPDLDAWASTLPAGARFEFAEGLR